MNFLIISDYSVVRFRFKAYSNDRNILCFNFIFLFYRYSLNDKIKPIPPPLISVDTSHSISSEENGLPAVYGVPVHSRPSSRYSNRSHHRPRRDRSQHQQSSLQPFQSHSASSSGGSSAQFSKYSNGRMIIK